MNPKKYPMKRFEEVIKELDKVAEECALSTYDSTGVLPNVGNKLHVIKEDLIKIKKWLEEE